MDTLIALLLLSGIFTLLALCSDWLERLEKKLDKMIDEVVAAFADSL